MGRNNSADLHGWVEARLSDYVDKQLPPAERTQLEHHLTDCAQCQASLASLQWTITLVKQAPAPALKRSFVLPVPAKRAPMFAFGFARLATALATLLFFALVGVDLITQFGGSASAPLAAKSGATNQDIALAQSGSTNTAPVPTGAPQPTQAPPAPAALPPAPATTAEPAVGAAVATTAKPAVESAPKLATASPRQPLSGSALVTATLSVTATLAPTPTATHVPATVPPPTTIAQARAEPTSAPIPASVQAPQASITPLRVAEIGLFFLAIFFGGLMLLLARRK